LAQDRFNFRRILFSNKLVEARSDLAQELVDRSLSTIVRMQLKLAIG